MINYPSAPKKKTGRQKTAAFSNRSWTKYDSFKAETAAWLAQTIDIDDDGDEENSIYDWSINWSSAHKVGGYPVHGRLGVHL